MNLDFCDDQLGFISNFAPQVIKSVSYILSTLILLSISLNTLILSHFEINYEYIVSELCVEKDIENSCCKGTCHLNAELSKADSSRGNTEVSFLSSVELLNWFQSDLKAIKNPIKPLKESNKIVPHFSLLEGALDFIEYPPQVVA